MRTLPLTGHPTCPGQAQKIVLLQLILSLCTEGHRRPVWSWLLILNVLCSLTWADTGPDLDYQYIQGCLEGLKDSIQVRAGTTSLLSYFHMFVFKQSTSDSYCMWLHLNASNRSSVPLKQKSDAKLYTPSVNEIKSNCESWSLKCYMMELEMVMNEEGLSPDKDNVKCILDFANNISSDIGSCPPCEATALRSITAFLENLESFLQKLEGENAQDKR
ncbi:hypothetical protein WMY93_006946 [Mugilogobius chulae]|uniref:Interleukin n=1 Tax=Mugilogobius chulae TaxID=88201 RepID=A0AAW0PXM9_9GOBI